MKKLMIAAAIVCAAAMSQAASLKWSNGWLQTPENVDVAAGLNVYLIQNSAHGQDAFLTAVATATSMASLESTLNSWKLDNTVTGQYGAFDKETTAPAALTAEGLEKAYFVVVDSERVFLSDVIPADYNGLATPPVYKFAYPDQWGMYESKDAKTDTGSGWYSVVPEPTSGLLLLLGVAGLALRRRRA